MATAHAHPALQPMAVEHDRETPSSPAQSRSDLRLPKCDTPSSSHRAMKPSALGAYSESSPSSSGSASSLSMEGVELGAARSFLVSMRSKPSPHLSNLLLHSGYELGAPLSDIGEEETTPGSKRARSRTPSPPPSSPTLPSASPASWSRKSEKRMSQMSSSSSISFGSDFQWEGLDTRVGLSGRLRADLAASGDDSFGLDSFSSKRDSVVTSGDEETTTQALSNRAEQILANAKKRLTNMEGNLSRARTSLLGSQEQTPFIDEHKHTIGGLYRSISREGDRRLLQVSSVRDSKPSYASIQGAQALHARNYSETSVPAGSPRHPKLPEVRSASAMEYGYGDKSIDSVIYERSAAIANEKSITSGRSAKSSLTVLREEGGCQPTDITASNKVVNNRESAIRNYKFQQGNTSLDSGHGLRRSQSQISTRELQDHMRGLKTKIIDLRTGQQAEQIRRNSIQNLRAASSITAAEEWYAGAAEYKGGESPLSTKAGMGWRSQEALEDLSRRSATSPPPQIYGPPKSPSSSKSAQLPSSVDVGTVVDNCATDLTPTAHLGPDLDSYTNMSDPATASGPGKGEEESYMRESHSDESLDGRSDEAEFSVASSEEEQIYLNGVLEESLQEAEEPEVPPIRDVVPPVEAERHEDRVDAFDYEHFFLHSALGNYSRNGFHRRNPSEATVVSRVSRDSGGSVETTRGPPAEEDGAVPEEDGEETDEDGRWRREGVDLRQYEGATASVPEAPYVQHFRNNSIDSVSTAATFATATEGDNDSGRESDSLPSEILHWGERAVPSVVGAWPRSAANGPGSYGKLTGGHGSSAGMAAMAASNSRPSSAALPSTPVISPFRQSEGQESCESDEDSHHQPANTEILISALITLANPHFQSSGPAFSEVDKDLVVNLLRSVGAVCEEITGSESRGEVYESRIWRRKLDTARRILDGEIEIEEDD